jgi:uncharacterized membrane protein YidH (DUF202 family)
MNDGGEDDDLREFQLAQIRHRRLTALKLAIAGIVLIPIAIAARRWAEGLQAVQEASDRQFWLPKMVIVGSWGGLIVAGACILIALFLFVLTIAAADRLARRD